MKKWANIILTISLIGCNQPAPEFGKVKFDLFPPSEKNLTCSVEANVNPPTHLAEYVTVKAGSFQMGSPANEANRSYDETLHSVQLTQDFEIQQTEVTQAQWVAVMGCNPSQFSKLENCPNEHQVVSGVGVCPHHPVESVSWDQAIEFISKLNKNEATYFYRLPTEAEWEFAARGGTQTAFAFGNDVLELEKFGWYQANSSNQSQRVGSKLANQFGLFDMHGNVGEWVQDIYALYSTEDLIDPTGPVYNPNIPDNRLFRGGCWNCRASRLRSAARMLLAPQVSANVIGFRLVRVIR